MKSTRTAHIEGKQRFPFLLLKSVDFGSFYRSLVLYPFAVDDTVVVAVSKPDENTVASDGSLSNNGAIGQSEKHSPFQDGLRNVSAFKILRLS